MKKFVLSAAVITTLTTGLAQAEDPKPDNEVSFNIAVTSDYRFRGISQTRREPALQGGADYINNPTGIYVGTWLSSIKWIKDAGGGSDVEWDIYVGKRGEIVPNVSYDVGVLTYVYPSNDLGNLSGSADANTTEVYAQVGYGPAYLKYSHSLTNLFGFIDSKNSGYVDVGANIEVSDGYIVNLHAGHQHVKNHSAASYSDWKVGLTKDFGIVTGALAVVGTNADKTVYASPVNGKFMGKTAVVVSISKTF